VHFPCSSSGHVAPIVAWMQLFHSLDQPGKVMGGSFDVMAYI
jgi:hypothetical protein